MVAGAAASHYGSDLLGEEKQVEKMGVQQDLFMVTEEADSIPANAADGIRVTPKSILRKLKRQRYRCALTGIELTPETASLDHIVPIKHGGQHALDNVHIVHMAVNSMKGTLGMAEFLEWCRRVTEHQNTKEATDGPDSQ